MLQPFCFSGPKRAEANGTLTATFIYNGTPLSGAYVYLHTYPQGTMIEEKYFRPAQYILGPSDANGNFSVSVPDGEYRVMLMRKASVYGPPVAGDYIWRYDGYITVAGGATVNLGTVNAQVFSGPITVKGTVTNCVWTSDSAGAYCTPGTPLADWFVFATKTPCQPNPNYTDTPDLTSTGSNNPRYPEYYCYPYAKYPAAAPTGANGDYTIHLRNPGTYYIYAVENPGQRGYGRHMYLGPAPCGPITSSYSGGAPYQNNPLTVTSGGTYNMSCTWFPTAD